MNLIEVALQGIPISEEQCIGDSLESINMAFAALTGSLRAAQLTISSDLVKPVELSKLSKAFASQGQVITYDAYTATWVPSAAFSLPKNAFPGQVLTFDGSTNTWVPSATTRIDDELPKNASDGQLLAFYETQKAWLPVDPFSLPETSTNGQILAYSATTSSWQASSLPAGVPLPLSLNNLSITGASRGQVITYDTSTASWVPSAAPGSGLIPLQKLVTTGAQAGDAVVYNPVTQTWTPSAVGAKLPTNALPGQVLTFDGATNSWQPSATAIIETTIPLSRISRAGASNRNVILYDSTANAWIPTSPFPDGSEGQVLTYNSTTQAWVASASPVPNNYVSLARNVIVGNGGAVYNLTTFPSENSDDYIVVVDGVVQAAGNAYNVSGGVITFSNPVPTGSSIIVIVPKPAKILTTNVPTFKKNVATTTAGNASYLLLNYSNNNPENYLVYLNGVMQTPVDDYTISGNQITLIPTPAPGSSLLVMALINADGTQATTANNSQFFVDSNGRVGINTTTPTERLTVNGNIFASGTIYSTGSTFTNSLSAPALSGMFYGSIAGRTATFSQGVTSTSFTGGTVTGTTATFTTLVSTPNVNSNVVVGREATFTQAVSAPIIRGSFHGDGTFITNVGGVASIRAWVNFNSVGTLQIRASQNVSSITDNGVGDFTVNFTSHLTDADYIPLVQIPTSSDNLREAGVHPTQLPTTNACRIQIYETSYIVPTSLRLTRYLTDMSHVRCLFAR